MSLSPERFLLLDERHIETKAHQGHPPRHPDPVIDAQVADALASADKDRSENLMIVDLLRNDIGRVSRPGSGQLCRTCSPWSPSCGASPGLHHIHGSWIRALAEVDLLRACFPGGSITGAPRSGRWRSSRSWSRTRRNAYCGSIGYPEPARRMDTSICIAHPDRRGRPAPLLGRRRHHRRLQTRTPRYQETFDKVAASCRCWMPCEPRASPGRNMRDQWEMTSSELLTRFLLQRPLPPIAWLAGSNQRLAVLIPWWSVPRGCIADPSARHHTPPPSGADKLPRRAPGSGKMRA